MTKFAKKTFYVTTAIDYVNAEPHIGHAYQKIAADVLARWNRSKGDKVFFLTGTDEHGTKIERAAKVAKIPPKKFVNKLSKKFENAWKSLNIDFDKFICTTDKNHIRIAKKLIKKLEKDIYLGVYEGFYCSGCENYLTAKDLVSGGCPLHPSKIEKLKEKNYFFKLSKYQNKLLKLYKKYPEFISPKHRREEIINRVKEGLFDVSITRTTKWGIPYKKNLTIWVWIEALTNYITALGWPKGAKFKKFWPADVHLLGKDNAWFHCVIWPAMLLSAGIKPAKKVYVHGFLTVNNQKISKSLGNVISPVYLANKYGADAVRYFVLREIPFEEDGDFSEKTLAIRLNAELANNLGNLLSRTLTLAKNKVPKAKIDRKLKSEFEKTLKNTDKYINNLEFHHALEEIWSFISSVNKYIDKKKPWANKKNANLCIYNSLESLRVISALVYPFIPETAEEIAKQLGLKQVPKLKNLKYGKLKANSKLKKGKILFKKIDLDKVEEPFEKLDLRIAKVIDVKDVKGADKLYKIIVNAGPYGKRQLIASMKPYYKKSELKNKKIIIIANLKPAKFRGALSEGMLLAAEKGKKVGLLIAPNSEIGDRVFPHGIMPKPAKQISFEDFVKVKMKAKAGNSFYKDKILQTIHEEIEVEKIKDAAPIR